MLKIIRTLFILYIIVVLISGVVHRKDLKKTKDASYTPSQEEIEEYQESLRKQNSEITEEYIQRRTEGYISSKEHLRIKVEQGFFNATKKAIIMWGIVFAIIIVILLIKKETIEFWFGKDFEETYPLTKFFPFYPWGKK